MTKDLDLKLMVANFKIDVIYDRLITRVYEFEIDKEANSKEGVVFEA